MYSNHLGLAQAQYMHIITIKNNNNNKIVIIIINNNSNDDNTVYMYILYICPYMHMTSRSASKFNAPHCHHGRTSRSKDQGTEQREEPNNNLQQLRRAAVAKDTIHPIPWLDRPRKKKTDWLVTVSGVTPIFWIQITGVVHEHLSYLRKMIFEKPSGDQKDSCWTWPFN